MAILIASVNALVMVVDFDLGIACREWIMGSGICEGNPFSFSSASLC
jgi:hypothetical protein